MTAPSGWVELIRGSGPSPDVYSCTRIFYKIATLSEPSSYDITAAIAYMTGGIVAYRNVSSISGVGSVVESVTSGQNIVIPGFEETGKSMMVTIVAYPDNHVNPTPDFIPSMDRKIDISRRNARGLRVYDKFNIGDIPDVIIPSNGHDGMLNGSAKLLISLSLK